MFWILISFNYYLLYGYITNQDFINKCKKLFLEYKKYIFNCLNLFIPIIKIKKMFNFNTYDSKMFDIKPHAIILRIGTTLPYR